MKRCRECKEDMELVPGPASEGTPTAQHYRCPMGHEEAPYSREDEGEP